MMKPRHWSQKKITIDYDEYLMMQDQIKDLKDANSKLSRGASLVTVINVNEAMNLDMRHYPSRNGFDLDLTGADMQLSIAEVSETKVNGIVALGATKGVYFAGVETLLVALHDRIRTLNYHIDKLRCR